MHVGIENVADTLSFLVPRWTASTLHIDLSWHTHIGQSNDRLQSCWRFRQVEFQVVNLEPKRTHWTTEKRTKTQTSLSWVKTVGYLQQSEWNVSSAPSRSSGWLQSFPQFLQDRKFFLLLRTILNHPLTHVGVCAATRTRTISELKGLDLLHWQTIHSSWEWRKSTHQEPTSATQGIGMSQVQEPSDIFRTIDTAMSMLFMRRLFWALNVKLNFPARRILFFVFFLFSFAVHRKILGWRHLIGNQCPVLT